MSNWSMDLGDHTPQFGRTLPEGQYLVEVAGYEEKSKEKGDSIRFTFKVVKGDQTGGIVGSTLYVINENFSGSEGHKGASLDNWYNFLVAIGIKPSAFKDMRRVADKAIGKRLGIEVVHSDPTGPKERIYANVNSYFPAAALGDEGDEDEGEDTLDVTGPEDDDDGDVALADIS